MVPLHLFFLLFKTIRPKNKYLIDFYLFPHNYTTKIEDFTSFICNQPVHQKKRCFFIYFFLCSHPFDQKLESSLIFLFFFNLHTTTPPKYMILFHLFFLLCTTIWLKTKGLNDLYFLFPPLDQNILSSFISSYFYS